MLEQKMEDFAKLETANTGKTLKQTTNYDLLYAVDNIRYIAGAARILNGEAMAEYVSEGTSAVRREPIGVVGVITPWNYPLMMVVWRAFPALATGNSVVLTLNLFLISKRSRANISQIRQGHRLSFKSVNRNTI